MLQKVVDILKQGMSRLFYLVHGTRTSCARTTDLALHSSKVLSSAY